MRALNCIVLILSECWRASHTQFNGPAMVIEIVEVDEEAPRDGTQNIELRGGQFAPIYIERGPTSQQQFDTRSVGIRAIQ